MTSELQQNVLDAIRCNEKLKGLAEAEDWDAFVEYAPTCQQAIRQINTYGTETADEQLRQQLKYLLSLNDEIREITERQRDKLADVLRDLNQGRKARKAYNE